MPQIPFDIVGFDLDGTLLDTSRDLGVALNHALKLAGRAEVPLDEVRSLVGGGTKQMLRRALERHGGVPDEAELEPLADALVDFYEANIAAHSALFPGGEAMLDALAARDIKLAVVTNKMERLAVKLLGELGLSERFFTIIGGDTLGPGRAKPKPDLLHLMVERSGLCGGNGAAPRVAYVGDTTFDTGAARAAGVPCVLVSFGFCDGPPETLGATTVIDHFDQLTVALSGL